METKFPENEGYASLFLIGVRKDPSNIVERTGTAVLKRTYEINPVEGTLTPAAEAFPVFMQDQADNLVLNSDFESAEPDPDDNTKQIPIGWEPTNATILQVDDPIVADHHLLQVTGAANERVVQTLTFEEPLGGQQFWFSFLASTLSISATIANVQLEADGDNGTVIICDIDATVDNTGMALFEKTGTWPANLEATEMRVVLRMATNAAHTVFYDNVQVEERDHRTVWDPITTLRYEHDLASFKPEGDVIVLGFTDFVGDNVVKANAVPWLSHVIASNTPRKKALFGWEPRVGSDRGVGSDREDEAGTFDPPPSDTLPDDFNNRFYNGYRRTNVGEAITANSPFPYLPAGAQIEIERVAGSDYRFSLRGDTAAATYYYYNGTGTDDESNWQSEPVTMNLDTLVIEPEANRCYVVWRGVWPFDEQGEDAYRRLVVEASA